MPRASVFRFLQWRIGNPASVDSRSGSLVRQTVAAGMPIPLFIVVLCEWSIRDCCPLDIIFLRKNKVCYTIIEYICTIINDTSTFQKNQMPTE